MHELCAVHCALYVITQESAAVYTVHCHELLILQQISEAAYRNLMRPHFNTNFLYRAN